MSPPSMLDHGRWLPAAIETEIEARTALLPALGYERCTTLAKEALESGRGVAELVLEQGLMTREALDRVLDPASMTGE